MGNALLIERLYTRRLRAILKLEKLEREVAAPRAAIAEAEAEQRTLVLFVAPCEPLRPSRIFRNAEAPRLSRKVLRDRPHRTLYTGQATAAIAREKSLDLRDAVLGTLVHRRTYDALHRLWMRGAVTNAGKGKSGEVSGGAVGICLKVGLLGTLMVYLWDLEIVARAGPWRHSRHRDNAPRDEREVRVPKHEAKLASSHVPKLIKTPILSNPHDTRLGGLADQSASWNAFAAPGIVARVPASACQNVSPSLLRGTVANMKARSYGNQTDRVGLVGYLRYGRRSLGCPLLRRWWRRLSARLHQMWIDDTPVNVRNKVARGKFMA